jgi:CheY-like chemotaxis protein
MTFAGRGTITVLVVEDAPETREVLVELLELHGLRVLAAGSVEEAVGAAGRAETIDLLLADMNLPDGSGEEVARRVTRCHPHMRCLFLSGDRPPRLAAGQAYLRKPASVRTILGEIDSLLPQSA